METVNRTTTQKIAGVLVVLAIAAGIFLFTRLYGVGFPISESVGDNVYLLDKRDTSYQKGELVAFEYQGKPFKDYKAGDKFLKFAGCVAGDTLTVRDRSYFCNGSLMGRAVALDSTGKPVKLFIYNGEIPAGKFFAIGSHPKSYDSRYWGFVNDKDVYATATEIF